MSENGGQPTKPALRQALAVLSRQELMVVASAAQAVELLRRQLDLVIRGQRDLWREIRDRHGLPTLFDLDPASGVVYQSAAATPPGQEPVGD